MQLSARRWAWLLATVFAACGKKDATGPDTTPATVTISPASDFSLASGASQAFTAIVANQAGEPIAGATVSWLASNSTVASTPNAASGTFKGVKVGTASITASSGGIVSSAVIITVTHGAAAKLAIKTQPTGGVSGSSLGTQPVVEVQDPAGNPVLSSTANVAATIASGGGTLEGTATVAAATGLATFTTLTVRGGTATRTLTFASSGLTSATSTGFSVTANPTPVSVTVSPNTPQMLASSTYVQLTATVKNVDNITLGGSVTWASKDATVASVATNGLVSALKTGVTKVVAKTGSLTSDSVTVTVTPGSATKLVIRTQPAGAALGAAFTSQPVIEVQDANSNIVTSSTASVTAAIFSGAGTLTGTATIAAVAGVATFTNIAIGVNTGSHTIQFTSAALFSATSITITVSANPPSIALGDSVAAFVVAQAGGASQPRAISIDNPAGGALTTLSRFISYGAGGSGWLTATIGRDTTPTAITLTAAPGALANGVYTATVTLNAAAAINQPTVAVTMTVGAHPTRIEYGAETAKIIRLAGGATTTPTKTAFDAAGTPMGGVTYTFTSRGAGVATVDGSGVITGNNAGSTFVVASTAAGASDSVYVQVLPATGPVLYTDLTKFRYKLNDVIEVKVFMDMRGATLGSANFLLNYPWDDFFTGFLNTPTIVDGASALGTQTQTTVNGQIRATAAAALGVTGVVEFYKATFTVVRGPPRSLFLTLVPIDVVALDYSSLTSSVTALRYPMVIVP